MGFRRGRTPASKEESDPRRAPDDEERTGSRLRPPDRVFGGMEWVPFGVGTLRRFGCLDARYRPSRSTGFVQGHRALSNATKARPRGPGRLAKPRSKEPEACDLHVRVFTARKGQRRCLPDWVRTLDLLEDRLHHRRILERHGIKLAKEAVRKVLMRARIWLSKDERVRSPHRPRVRRDCLGELVQVDGYEHHWFGPWPLRLAAGLAHRLSLVQCRSVGASIDGRLSRNPAALDPSSAPAWELLAGQVEICP
jgi:hypothetical protein